MKVVHINTFSFGGAAKAAIRQHLALLDNGIDSKIIFLEGSNIGIPCSSVLGSKLAISKRIFRKLGIYQTKWDKNEEFRKRVKGSYEFISFPETDYCLHLLKAIREADVVNLHWIANFVDYPSFFKLVKAPILWTLHDMNPLLGLYHYLGDEIASNGINFELDEKLKKIKQESVLQHKKLEFAAPSKWLFNELAGNKFYNRFKSHHIPYSLDLDIFSLYEKEKVRNELGIKADSKVLLFVSENVNNKRKGFDFLINALNRVDEENITLCTIGSMLENSLPIKHPIKLFGRIDDENLLAKIFSASDAFILPSLEDNLPNVMLESLACGTPVISFALGGMVDLIQHEKNGFLSENVSVEGLKHVIDCFLNNGVKWSKEKIREDAVQKISYSVQVNRLLEVYKDLLS